MINRLRQPTLENYIYRYRLNKEMLERHLEHRELLQRQIDRAEKAIIEYVTSDSFVERLKYLNL